MSNDQELEEVRKVVTSWFDGEYTMFDSASAEPEIAWAAILAILSKDLTEEQRGLLAAGPLETLLSWHGEAVIDRVVKEGENNNRFNYLLGGLWPGRIPEQVWRRIEKVRRTKW